MNLDNWMVDTITVAPFTGRDSYGSATYDSQRTQKARVERRQARVTNDQGQEVPTNTVVATLTYIAPQDRVWLLEDDIADNNAARIPAAVSFARDKEGNTVLHEVFF